MTLNIVSGNNVCRCVVVLLFILASAAGCAVGPDYTRPEVPVMDQWIEEQNPALSTAAADLAQWWKRFNDPVLDALMEKAFRQNMTLRIAGIRILEARAQLGIVAGNSYPQVQQLRAITPVSASAKMLPTPRPSLTNFRHGLYRF